MKSSRIASTGGYLPPHIVTNDYLAAQLDTSDAWIRDRTGIRSRRFAPPGIGTVDLALAASQTALERASISGHDLDLIVVGTITPDMTFPTVAASLQARVGARSIGCFDLSAACSGFVYALSVADAIVRAGNARKALVVGVDKMSRIVDPKDRGTRVLFGDGAGAVVLVASDLPGVMSSHLHADGSAPELLHCAPRSEYPFVKMQGGSVFRFAVRGIVEAANEALDKTGLSAVDVDWLIPHQANLRIIEAAAKQIGIGMDRVVVTVDTHANTSAASIPLALDAAVTDGRIARNDKVLLVGVGGGFTWSSAMISW